MGKAPGSQFDPRYRLPPREQGAPALEKRARFVEDEERRALARLSHRPAGIAWFEEQLGAWPSTDAPLVGTFCNMVPEEIIHALGAVPVRLGCGNAAMVQPGEEVFSGEICPLAKASFATFLREDGPAERCSALVVPTTCDAKRKLGEVLGDFVPTFVLNLPPEQDAGRYTGFAADELDRLVRFLEASLGTKLRRKALRAAIDRSQRMTSLVRRLQEARIRTPAALSVRDLFIIVQASFAGVPVQRWCEETEKVIEEAEAFRSDRPRLRPRLVLTGAPVLWPNFKVLNLVEECGADMVADTLCSGAQARFDPPVIDGTGRRGLLRALAQRSVFASNCPCFVSQGTRLSRVLDLVETARADGVLSYGLRLCQLFDIEAYRLQAVLKERRIPHLNLRTDYSLEDTEQLRVRLEAFLETVEEEA